jgi:hypothetical protein
MEVPRAAINFPGVFPIPNLNVTPGGGTFDQTETTVAVGLGAFSNAVVVGYNDRAALNGGFSGYSFSTDGGRTFTQSTAMPQPAGGGLSGDPVLDTHPNFPGRVYYANLCSAGAFPAGTIGICVSISNDGGQTFGNPVIVATPTCGVNVPGPPADCDTFDKEWLAVDPFTGNVYIAYTNFVGGGPPSPPAGPGSVRGQIEAVVCNAALTTCSAPFAVAGAAGVFRQGVSVTFGRAAGQQMVLAWYNRTSGFIESTNCSVVAGPGIGACAALTNVVNVGTFAAAPYADPAATAGCQRPSLRAASVPFAGFGAGTVAGFRYEPFPIIAADNAFFPGAAGFTHLVVTYAAGFAGGGANDVAYFRSANNGGTWPVGPLRVNDNLEFPALGQVSDQFFPHISAPKDDPAGRLNVTWYDRRNDQTSLPEPNLLIEVFHSESVDRGTNWQPSGLVTDVSFPALPIPGTAANPFCYWGDYIGHASHVLGDRIYVAWGDDRSGQIDTYFAILHETQDVRVQGTLEFGAIAVNAVGGEPAFKDLEFEVLNVGTLNLIVNSVTCVGAQCTDFSVLPAPATPLTISPNAHVSFVVRFNPTVAGARSAIIRVSTNDPDQPTIDIPANGIGVVPDIRVTGSTEFGNSCAAGAQQQVSVCNVGASNLNVTGASINCPDFTIVNNPFPAVVSPDSCVGLTIRFTPTSPGEKTCTLTITSNDPDTPSVSLTVHGNVPAPSIDVAPDQSFLPEVIQSVGTCTTERPFPISNTGGLCALTITSVAIGGTNASDFALSGLPSFPIILEPGHQVGEGDLRTVFAPTVVDRDRLATLTVTYVSNPVTGATTSVTRNLCGEGVRTGARVLVRAGGVPLATVERIHLQRINANRNRGPLDSMDNARDLPLQTVIPAAPCAPFQYHREYGTVSNPIQLLPGSYQVTVTAIVNGKRETQVVAFNVDTCDFNPTVIVDF